MGSSLLGLGRVAAVLVAGRRTTMVDTTVLKRVVEPFVRRVLAKEFGVRFESRIVALSTGGTHEFDAVSDDGSKK